MIIWQRNWRAFDAPEKEEDFLRELRKETGPANPAHPLHDKECHIIGWAGRGWGDFLLQIPADNRYAYIHLTWHEETDPRWPHCQFFDTVDAVNTFLRDEE